MREIQFRISTQKVSELQTALGSDENTDTREQFLFGQTRETLLMPLICASLLKNFLDSKRERKKRAGTDQL